MRDMYSNIKAVPALAPAVHSASANGATVDLLGVGRMAFVLNTGAIVSAGDFTATVEESDDGSAFAAVVEGATETDAPATLTASGTFRIGYRGNKRYVRLVLTKNGGTSIAASAVAVLGDLANRPAV